MLYLFAFKKHVQSKEQVHGILEVSRVLACDVGVDRSTCGHRLSEEELSTVVFIGTRVGIPSVAVQC